MYDLITMSLLFSGPVFCIYFAKKLLLNGNLMAVNVMVNEISILFINKLYYIRKVKLMTIGNLYENLCPVYLHSANSQYCHLKVLHKEK